VEQVGDYHYLHKNEGDFLLIENNEGDSHLISRKMLRELILSTKCELDFVVVATCHSEFVGRIFLEAGAKHVICVKNSEEVKDQAAITFTETFYDSVFTSSLDICSAFENAKIMIKINHGSEEANKFELLVGDGFHSCGLFGPFPSGKFRQILMDPCVFKILPPKETNLIGRQLDTFKLI